jgi:hypothetical protein
MTQLFVAKLKLSVEIAWKVLYLFYFRPYMNLDKNKLVFREKGLLTVGVEVLECKGQLGVLYSFIFD